MALESSFQHNGSRGLRVSDPLRVSTACNQKSLASEFQQVDRRGVGPAALPPRDLKQVVVLQAQPKADQDTEEPVEDPLHRIRLMKRNLSTHRTATASVQL